jgi:putative endonuclease
MFNRQCFYTYILTNVHHTVLYVGMTNNLRRRTTEHFEQIRKCFTSRYKTNKLVYYEEFDSDAGNSEREATQSGISGSELRLIKAMNPNWNDLYTGL